MVSLQVACKQMHGEFLTSAVNISDHSDAMKKGLDFLNVRGFGLGAAALSALGIPVPMRMRTTNQLFIWMIGRTWP